MVPTPAPKSAAEGDIPLPTIAGTAMVAAMMAAVSSAKAQLFEFTYDAGFEAVSSYIWRGMYNGGLSFQPDL